MIRYTERLDKALRRAAWAHEQQGQHRKGTDIPFVIHPVGVMMIASGATDDEDTLIACLLHDVLEDVSPKLYSKQDMLDEFGDHVVSIVADVTHDIREKDWHKRSHGYIEHLRQAGSSEAVTVCAADKIHNLQSILIDYKTHGDDLWKRFTTKSGADQLWWYESVLVLVKELDAPQQLIDTYEPLLEELRSIV